jgi:asparagine synthase (glutamine-hydrolysing)
MCGIVGYSSRQWRQETSDWLKTSIENIRHRGPDDSGSLEEPNHTIGIGHTRLAIIDTSSLGHQPMFSEDRSVALVFNGEIYNYKIIRKELESYGEMFQSDSDTEVLLKLYLLNRGCKASVCKMLTKLNGIFAFAVWDAKEERMLIARDRFGVKPIYYSENRDGLFFASEIKALPYKFDSVDNIAVNQYLNFIWCPGTRTAFKGIKKIGPGEAMFVKRGEIAERFQWYKLPVFTQGQRLQTRQFTITQKPDAKHLDISRKAVLSSEVASLRHHLRSAVHRQMISDVPLGAFLSGGLDSSSIVAFAREINPEIQCYTIDFGSANEGFTEDLPFARKVADHLGVPLTIVKVEPMKFMADLSQMVVQLDEPIADPAPLNVLYICQAARQQGIKVLLSGCGGDDILSGYRRHRAVQMEKYFRWIPRPARLIGANLTKYLNQHNPLQRRISKLLCAAQSDGYNRMINYFKWIDRSDIIRLYTPEFYAEIDDSSPEDPMLEFLASLPEGTPDLEKMLALEQRFFLCDHNLNYTDKMSMAVGVEVRVPFLDNDLVDFSWQLSSDLKQRGSVGKWILKKAMEQDLPSNVIYRNKTGFGAPLRNWIQNEMSDLVSDVLSEKSLRRRGMFRAVAVNDLISRNRCGKIDASYTIFSLMCIEIWCRHYLDGAMQTKI